MRLLLVPSSDRRLGGRQRVRGQAVDGRQPAVRGAERPRRHLVDACDERVAVALDGSLAVPVDVAREEHEAVVDDGRRQQGSRMLSVTATGQLRRLGHALAVRR